MKKGWVVLATLLLLLSHLTVAMGECDKDFTCALPFGSGMDACGRWVEQRLEDALPKPVEIDHWRVSTLPGSRSDVFGIPMRYRFVFSGGKLAQFVAEHEADISGTQAIQCYVKALEAVESSCGVPKDGRILLWEGAGREHRSCDYPLYGGARDPEALQSAAADLEAGGASAWFVEYYEDRMVVLALCPPDEEESPQPRYGISVFIQPGLADEMGKNRPFEGADGDYRAALREGN